MTNDTTNEGNLTCLLVLTEMVASKLENNDNLMKLLTLAQLDASKLEYENAKLVELNNIRILQTQHCEDLTVENKRMRELLRGLYSFAFQEYPDGVERNFADELRKLGIEVETDEDW